MGFLSAIEKFGGKIGDFLEAIVHGANALQKTWGQLSGPTLAAAAAVFYDTVKTLSSAESAATAAASGNVLSTVTLSETTLGLVKQVIADAKSGEKQIVDDVKALKLAIQ